jgi:hypothetical protein
MDNGDSKHVRHCPISAVYVCLPAKTAVIEPNIFEATTSITLWRRLARAS